MVHSNILIVVWMASPAQGCAGIRVLGSPPACCVVSAVYLPGLRERHHGSRRPLSHVPRQHPQHNHSQILSH